MIKCREEGEMLDKKRIGHRLRAAREAAGLSQEELGKMVGYSQGNISDWERGRLNVKVPIFLKLVKALRQPMSFFIGEEIGEPERTTEWELRQARHIIESALEKIPMPPPGSEPVKWVQSRGEVPGGMPADTLEVEYVPVPASFLRNDDVYAVTVCGDSMIGRGIRSGDRVIVDPNLSARDGDIVIACKNDEKVIRIYREDEDDVHLIAATRGYPRLLLKEATILGVVTGWFRHDENKA